MSEASAGTIAMPVVRTRSWRFPARLWPAIVAAIALVPFLPGLRADRMFFVRDLSQFFWGRHLWLRRTLWSGEWPLWDPYIAGGQSAVADALHQMFLLPVLAIRLVSSEVLGFNLWVSLPFPLAAASAYFFFSTRFDRPASAIGALAFAIAGPVVSTGNVPNMAWTVAALPLVLWAADRLAQRPSARGVALLAAIVAFQALAGEPVTLAATLSLAVPFAFVVSPPIGATWSDRGRRVGVVAAGIGLGVLGAALQLVPTAEAAMLAERWRVSGDDLWSLHPLMLLETLVPHLFGDYFSSRTLTAVPWMQALNTGREPFFFSLYFGAPLLTLSLFGVLAGERRWSIFWCICGAAGLVGAFGSYTPIYPLIRDHLPLVDTFRFPVKYLIVLTLAVAAAAAAGWQALTTPESVTSRPYRRARSGAICGALAVGVTAYAIAGAFIYLTTPAAHALFNVATALELPRPIDAAEVMLKTLPRLATVLMLLSIAAAVLLFLAASHRREASIARAALSALVAGDLLVRAWGVNPVLDPQHLKGAEWFAETSTDPHGRFYIGGKLNGAIEFRDIDAPAALYGPEGMTAAESRAAIHGQTAHYPSGWRRRELLSADLALLWPRDWHVATERFAQAPRAARDRFLDRTGVRFRVLPSRLADVQAPLMKVRYLQDAYLYDWGSVTPRASVVTSVSIVPDTGVAIDRLFAPEWDSRTSAIIDRPIAPAGQSGPPQTSFASIKNDRANGIAIDAGAPAGGGYLVLLDSYSPDWRAVVDGTPAELARANGLFRAVHLAPGRHLVEFHYAPRAFLEGAAISALALVIISALAVVRRPIRPSC
jgi:hypothetical protein